MRKEGNQTVETAVEARGGFLGRPVFVVLAVSLVLAVAAMALSYAGSLRRPRNAKCQSTYHSERATAAAACTPRREQSDGQGGRNG